ncbi:MAG: SGNH/GDSL hydrolase family protein [Verrucomicrobiota bacterium]
MARPNESAGIPSPIYHHGLKPGFASTRYRFGPLSYPMFVNSLGMRDRQVREVSLSPPKGWKRLLIIGDSFTEGVGYAYEKTFVGLVAEELNPRQIEVLNAGVGSYSPIVYWKKVKALLDQGVRFESLVVFLDISDIEDEINYYLDEQGSVRTRSMEVIGGGQHVRSKGLWARGEHFVRRHLWLTTTLARLTRRWVTAKKSGTRHGNILNLPRARWTVDPRLRREFGEMGLKRAEQHLTQLRAVLDKHGIQHMTLAVYPWPTQIYYGDLDSVQVKYWEKWCATNRVRFVNFFPSFVPAPGGSNRSRDVLSDYFIPYDMHWNEAGHRLIARQLLAEIDLDPLK